MVAQQRNNNKNFPNLFISVIHDTNAVYEDVHTCHNCKEYTAASDGANKMKNHLANVHGYSGSLTTS